VTYFSALRWWLIVLLPLTIAWKLAIKAEDPAEVQKSIIEFLRQQDFAIAITDDRMEYMDIIRATSPSCELQVAKISPLGHEADLVRKVAPPGDRTFYLYRGKVYQDQPIRLTVQDYFLYRTLRELGFARRVPPVLAVTSSCEAERLPWRALARQQPM
jgi:hypothetical protein